MAAVVTLLKDGYDVWGGRTKVQHADIALDNSYPTGGYALPATKFGMKEIWNMIIGDVGDADAGGYRFLWDSVNKKLMVFRSAGFTPAGTNSKPTFTVEASGSIGANMEVGLSADSAAATFEGGTGITAQRTLTTTSPVGTPTFTGTAVAAAALVQVANATDLSAVNALRVTALGR